MILSLLSCKNINNYISTCISSAPHSPLSPIHYTHSKMLLTTDDTKKTSRISYLFYSLCHLTTQNLFNNQLYLLCILGKSFYNPTIHQCNLHEIDVNMAMYVDYPLLYNLPCIPYMIY